MKKLESSLLNMVLVLTAISLIAGGTLAYINKVTQGPIAEINAKNLQDGIKKVILGGQPGDLKVEEPVESNGYTLYKTDKGTAVKAVTNGFGGPLEILVGFNEDGNILGYTILATVETPGLGVTHGSRKEVRATLSDGIRERRNWPYPKTAETSTPSRRLPLPAGLS